jgi:hypothetical protein
MSQVIRIEKNLYQRLAKHSNGFETPSQVISKMIDFYETKNNIKPSIEPIIEKSTNLEIIYYPNNDINNFKQQLIAKKMAYINIHKINGKIEIIEWNAYRFKDSSDIEKNLRSGYLRDWKDKGIFKAELSTNQDDFGQISSSIMPKMKNEFHKYMINKGMSANTASSYKSSINSISKDYSQKMNQNIDIYQIQEQSTINEIAQKYSQEGKYAIDGKNGRATWRNAIAKYSKFFASSNNIKIIK